MEMKTINVQFVHPFTSMVIGPSGCGKSTFVKDLLLHQEELISSKFDKIYIIIGTSLSENKIFQDLQAMMPDIITVMELKKMYPDGLKNSSFYKDFSELISKNSETNLKTCVIFDDLMNELAEIQLLDEMFTKWSSHCNTSVIHITQNLFHKGKGANYNPATLYRNCKVLVLFDSPMDQTPLKIVAVRLAKLGKGNRKNTEETMSWIVSTYRYVVIRGALQTPKELKFTSDLFANKPFRHMKCFTVK